MRTSLVKAIALSSASDSRFCVLCGDLGYNALEPLHELLGKRFINAGIAEQNMVSMAAGLAALGMRPCVYSISPFIYARAFEQIRNDVCIHNLPVCFIGSGAGYGYGINGPTHHALEDYGTMSSLQNIHVYTTSFKSDMPSLVKKIFEANTPSYIRLGRDETSSNTNMPEFQKYRKLCSGNQGVVLSIGGIAGMLIDICNSKHSLWCCGELPIAFEDIPQELLIEIQKARYFAVIEDHVSVGGLGEQFIKQLVEHEIPIKKFYHCYAKGYISGLYGSQEFYRKENGLDKDSLERLLNNA